MAEQKEKRRMSTLEVKKLPKDSTFYVLGVVSRFTQRKDKNENTFWDISIMDNEGQIDGKIWGNSEWWNITSDLKYKIDPLDANDETLKNLEGKTIGVQGKIVEFREQNQCNFNAVYYVDQDKYPPHGFVRCSPVSYDKMEKVFLGLLEICTEPMKNFLKYIFFERDLWKNYSTWPAAVTMHHAYVNGLLEHSLSVTNTALVMARNYIANMALNIDIDVVIAGALLHDLGKLEAYRLAPAPEVTTEGNVIDHIVIGYHNFMTLVHEYSEYKNKKGSNSSSSSNSNPNSNPNPNASQNLNANLANLTERQILAIGHILVSHHGTREFGSPVLPETPEALIVSVADELDFKIYCWKEQTSQLEGGKEVTDFVPSVQRRFWKGSTLVSSSEKLEKLEKEKTK